MDYAVELYFDNVSEKNINSLMLDISNKTGNKYMVENKIPPHLSISLFNYDETIDKIIDIIENNINKFQKNNLFIASFGVFNPQVLFLSPVFNKYLIECNKNIIQIIQNIENIKLDKYYLENNWVPHISLGVKLNEEELLNGIKLLTENFNIMEIEVNRIGIAKCNPNKEIKVWEI